MQSFSYQSKQVEEGRHFNSVMADSQDYWREKLVEFLVANSFSCRLSLLGSSIPRPNDLPKGIKLIDILDSDPLKRFTVHGEGGLATVKLNKNCTEAGWEIVSRKAPAKSRNYPWESAMSSLTTKESSVVKSGKVIHPLLL